MALLLPKLTADGCTVGSDALVAPQDPHNLTTSFVSDDILDVSHRFT